MSRKNSKEKHKEDVAGKEQEVEKNEQLKDEVSEKVENTKDIDDNKESENTPEEEVDQVAMLEKQLAELNDKHLRLIAEYDNYRKRTLKEKLDLTKTAGQKIFVNILPVIDDFQRAIQHLDTANDLDAIRSGIELIYNKFMNYLSQHGVKAMDAVNQEFNADLHEAISKVPAPSEEMKGKIIDCVETGYVLDDKVIRFPKVIVGE